MNPPAADAVTAPRRILIVDDDARLRQIIALQLRLSGAWQLVGAVATAEEALRLAVSERPALVLLDLWLADGASIGLISALRAIDHPPAVIILTAESDLVWRERALAAGASAYLNKIDVLDIPAALRAL